MDKIILLLLLSVIGSVTKGNAQLQCHVCNNCPNPNELDSNLVQTCSLQSTTTTTTPSTTTTPTTTTSSTTTTTTTTPDVTTPDGPIITTQPPTVIPPEDTTVDGPIITTQPPPISPPSTTTQSPVSPPDFLRQKFLHFVRQSLSGYQCFVVHRTVGDSVQVNRGCVLARDTHEQTCSDANAGEVPSFCNLCTSDGCNDTNSSPSSTYAVPFAILLSSLFVLLKIR